MTSRVDFRPVTSSPRILIVGAGVLGLCTAFELHRRGHAVMVVDPGGPNASRVAAGMIAPAMESAIDDVSPARANLFRNARDLWPAFAKAAGITLIKRPAEWRGGDVEAIAARMRALGFDVRREGDRAITDEDYQVDPAQALDAFRQALGDAVVEGQVTAVEPTGEGWRVSVGPRDIDATGLVMASGAADAAAGLPDATASLIEAIQPIRGQIGVTAQALVPHVVRGPGAYVSPIRGGAVIGATMEPGRRDTAPDAAVSGRLIEAASAVLGEPVSASDIQWAVGIRGATADGLPMAGPAPDEWRLWLALAPRRNGWLLGPLVARTVADAVEGRTPAAESQVLAPRRFITTD